MDKPPFNPNDARTWDWLYHVDINLATHTTAEQVASTAKIAFDALKAQQPFKPGDVLMLVAIRKPNG